MNYFSYSTNKSRNLIIGCDFAALHSYLRNCTQENVLGFVYSLPTKPPITHFKGPSTDILEIHPLDQLEKAIRDKKIQKCEMQIRGLSMSDLRSIINRIISTGSCIIEFFPPRKYSFVSCKPVIAITSLAPKIGKSQLARYFCSVLRNLNTKVSVIIPIIDIKECEGVFTVKQGIHYEFKESDPIPPNIFDPEDEKLIKNYQKSGAIRIYATSDYEKAIIIAEQHSDIIIFDAKGCEYPTISVSAHSAFPQKSEDKSSEKKNEKRKYERFCVINEETLLDIGNKSLWPGIFNLLFASNIVIISPEDSEPNSELYSKLLEGKNIYYANYHFIDQEEASENNSSELDNDNNNNNNDDDDEDSQNQDIMESKLEYIIVPKPNENEEFTFYDSNEINDIDYNLFQYLVRYSPEDYTPPLKNHFEAQVDILTRMSNASNFELRDNNNDAANRETFCRLFLESHLPPNYRITSGEIIDSFSNGTGQLDVIIATEDCPIMTMNLTSSVIAPILADDVLGVVEVKTSLNRESLKKALTQLRPVKALMPMHKTLKLADGKIIDDPLDGKIITGIFSFESKMSGDITNFLRDYQGIVDFIVIPEKFSIFWAKTLKVCGISVDESEIENGYVKYMQKGSGLALMFGILNTLAATRGFSGSNAIRYLGGFWGGIEEKILNIKNEAIKLLENVLSNLINNGKSKTENKACFKEISSMIYQLQREKSFNDDGDDDGNIKLSRKPASNRSNFSTESSLQIEDFVSNDNDNDNDN